MRGGRVVTGDLPWLERRVGRAALKLQAPVTEGREAWSATEKLRTGTVTESQE